MSLRSGFLGVVFLLIVGAPAFADDGAFRIGVEGNYPPFSELGPDGEVFGYDIDIGKALCAQMKIKCVFVRTDWRDLLPELEAGKLDAVIGMVSITEKRRKRVDFTAPYYNNKVQFIAAKSAEFDVARLSGKILGAQDETVSAEWLAENVKGAEIRLYKTQTEAYDALSKGEIFAVLADSFVSWDWLVTSAGRDFEFKGKPVLNDDKIGIAIPKGNAALVNRINNALKEITENGQYQLINDKYFSFEARPDNSK